MVGKNGPDAEGIDLVVLVLGAASAVVEQLNAGMVARGFTDVRPLHGFAFVRLSGAGATMTELAKHLGVTKQAASVIAAELVQKGYVRRDPHSEDRRAQVLTLTTRGRACTRAATEVGAELTQRWRADVGLRRSAAAAAALAALGTGRRLKPVW